MWRNAAVIPDKSASEAFLQFIIFINCHWFFTTRQKKAIMNFNDILFKSVVDCDCSENIVIDRFTSAHVCHIYWGSYSPSLFLHSIGDHEVASSATQEPLTPDPWPCSVPLGVSAPLPADTLKMSVSLLDCAACFTDPSHSAARG